MNESLVAGLFEGNPLPTDPKKLEKKLCDHDLRDYGEPSLPSRLSKDVLSGPVILQLTKYRNVSQPKVREDAQSNDDVARLSLTDGHTSVSALLLDNFKGLSSDTPPGTKLLITGAVPIECGFVLLSPKNVTVVGGRVDSLIEKWTIERHALVDSQRTARTDGTAPKWISFGKRGAANFDPSTKDFKANDVLTFAVKKDADEQSSFELQRKENIEAVAEGTAKVFAAPKIQPPLKSQEPTFVRPRKPAALIERGHDRREKKGRRRGGDSDDEEVPAEFARPSKPSTLFDFVAPGAVAEAGVANEPPPRDFNNDRTSNYSRGDQFSRGQGRFQRGRGPAAPRGNPRHEERGGGQARGRGRPTAPSRFSDANRDGNNPRQKNSAASNQYQQRGQRDNQRSFNPSQYDSRDQTFKPKSNAPANDRSQFPPLMGTSKAEPPRFTQSADRSIQEQVTKGFSKMRVDDSYRRPDLSNTTTGGGIYRSTPQSSVPRWKVGDQCKAPWNDGTYYLATIVHLGPADMCAVRYENYGNIGTVPQAVLLYV